MVDASEPTGPFDPGPPAGRECPPATNRWALVAPTSRTGTVHGPRVAGVHASRRPNGHRVPGTRIGFDTVRFLVGAAMRAPSVHNSQPWRLVYQRDGAVNLWADRSRVLPGIDPDGRELLMSCGALLAGLSLGLRWLGYQPLVVRCPDRANPDLLARVTVGVRQPSGHGLEDSFAALMDRYTHRGAFAGTPLAPPLLTRLQRVATGSGTAAHLIDNPGMLRGLVRVTGRAQAIQNRDGGAHSDLRRWLRAPGSDSRDGLAVLAGHPARASRYTLAPRFSSGSRDDAPQIEGAVPATMLLATYGDDPLSWLRAGEALHHLLLAAARESVFASIHSQPIEVPSTRTRLANLTQVRPTTAYQLRRRVGGWGPARAAKSATSGPAAAGRCQIISTSGTAPVGSASRAFPQASGTCCRATVLTSSA